MRKVGETTTEYPGLEWELDGDTVVFSCGNTLFDVVDLQTVIDGYVNTISDEIDEFRRGI